MLDSAAKFRWLTIEDELVIIAFSKVNSRDGLQFACAKRHTTIYIEGNYLLLVPLPPIFDNADIGRCPIRSHQNRLAINKSDHFLINNIIMESFIE